MDQTYITLTPINLEKNDKKSRDYDFEKTL